MVLLDDTLQRTAASPGTAVMQGFAGPLRPNPGSPAIEFTAEKVQDAAARFPGCRVTVLNFASGVTPGGGVRRGAEGQEEDLCRCSGLLHGLESLPQFYAQNRSSTAPPECVDAMIVSRDVPLVRTSVGALVEPPVSINVLTYPAPNATREEFRRLRDVKRDAVLGAIFERRCAHVVHQATVVGTDVLILGPWGCGAYGNDPWVVAKAFKAAVGQYGGGIVLVLFACFGPMDNREAFREVLAL